MFVFRKTILSEADYLQQWHDATAVKRWVPIENWKSYFQAVLHLKNYYLYSVYLEENLIAYIAAEIQNGCASICLVVDPSQHGQGIGTAVLLEMQRQTQNLFGHVHTYIAGIFPENIHSIRCFEKAGFVKREKGNDCEDLYFHIIRRE